jgi:hypothetical protein
MTAGSLQNFGIQCRIARKPVIKSLKAVIPVEFVNQFEKDPRAKTPDQFALPLSPKSSI